MKIYPRLVMTSLLVFKTRQRWERSSNQPSRMKNDLQRKKHNGLKYLVTMIKKIKQLHHNISGVVVNTHDNVSSLLLKCLRINKSTL